MPTKKRQTQTFTSAILFPKTLISSRLANTKTPNSFKSVLLGYEHPAHIKKFRKSTKNAPVPKWPLSTPSLGHYNLTFPDILSIYQLQATSRQQKSMSGRPKLARLWLLKKRKQHRRALLRLETNSSSILGKIIALLPNS